MRDFLTRLDKRILSAAVWLNVLLALFVPGSDKKSVFPFLFWTKYRNGDWFMLVTGVLLNVIFFYAVIYWAVKLIKKAQTQKAKNGKSKMKGKGNV